MKKRANPVNKKVSSGIFRHFQRKKKAFQPDFYQKNDDYMLLNTD